MWCEVMFRFIVWILLCFYNTLGISFADKATERKKSQDKLPIRRIRKDVWQLFSCIYGQCICSCGYFIELLQLYWSRNLNPGFRFFILLLLLHLKTTGSILFHIRRKYSFIFGFGPSVGLFVHVIYLMMFLICWSVFYSKIISVFHAGHLSILFICQFCFVVLPKTASNSSIICEWWQIK